MNSLSTFRPLLAILLLLAGFSRAQSNPEDSIAQYRDMLADGNPSELFEAKGEALWALRRGPRQASLEQCDLGLGPGVVPGAFVQLPRWFADTRRVQDLESRLLSCMQTLQGTDTGPIMAGPFGTVARRELEALTAWISAQSTGRVWQVPQEHPEERRMYDLGRQAFFYRAGPMDFSCASCHGQPGKRIRLQTLPDLSRPGGDGAGFASWPAYRVSTGEFWSLQHRLNDCFRQQRFPYPGYTSEVTIALGVYMGVNTRGARSSAPAIKR